MTIGAITALIFGFGNLYHPTVVVGESMAPTLDSGRVIWVDRTAYLNRMPERGEVVVFRHEGEVYVKRVYRAPGETVHYLANGGDWISPVRESSLKTALEVSSRLPMRYQVKSLRVPEDAVFVMGDNVYNSVDSRELGPISITELIGRAHLDTNPLRFALYEYIPRWRNAARARAEQRSGHAARREADARNG